MSQFIDFQAIDATSNKAFIWYLRLKNDKK